MSRRLGDWHWILQAHIFAISCSVSTMLTKFFKYTIPTKCVHLFSFAHAIYNILQVIHFSEISSNNHYN